MDLAKVKILLVDDLEGNLLALEGLLRRPDVEIFKAKSGTEALELMIPHEFAVALVDVQMPAMSGFELAEFMRSVKRTMGIPIIFVTATALGQSFSFKGYESGAVDFLLKPLDTHAVKSKVNIFIELYRQKSELKGQLERITRLLEDLSLARIEAERASAAKSQFLANMSHEIRTPIGAIMGFVDLMKNPANTSGENHQYIGIVDRNAKQLLKLIDEILDLSKVEAGKMTIENLPFSLNEMLADFAAMMELKAKEKGIRFQVDAPTPLPDLIHSDPLRLRQILANVLGNAIKFTDKGQVELSVTFADPILQFTITDTGLGISPDQASRLFQAFAQADSSTTRKFGGTGLGLILARHLAELLGGGLQLIKSHEGVGSTFMIEVKITVAEKSSVAEVQLPVHHQDVKVLRDLKVLLVEDLPDNQLLITFMLEKEGARVKLASDGAQGVALALAGDFDVLLMDVQMPTLDGHGAAQQLRRANFSKPIIALTALAMNEGKVKCLESGFTDFLVKPIERDLLVNALSRYARSASAPRA